MLEKPLRAERLLTDVHSYVDEALGIDLRLTPCDHRPLPAYLTHAFEFRCGTLLGCGCVFAVDRGRETLTPYAIDKHFVRLEKALAGRQPVLVTSSMAARARKRLVERGIPFIVPFAQLYLPPLGIDFREKVRSSAAWRELSAQPGPFAPVTQTVLLRGLLRQGDAHMHAATVANALGYSQMSISRAFRDLEIAGLFGRPAKGQQRPAHLVHDRLETWQLAQPLLRSPVRKRYLAATREMPHALEAGITALAQVSNLSAPREPTIALSPESWRQFKADVQVDPLPSSGVSEPGQMIVEAWSYAPEALSTGPVVDVLSLYLSLRDEHDERVEAALEAAMGGIGW